MNEAMPAWLTNVRDKLYPTGSVVAPAPGSVPGRYRRRGRPRASIFTRSASASWSPSGSTPLTLSRLKHLCIVEQANGGQLALGASSSRFNFADIERSRGEPRWRRRVPMVIPNACQTVFSVTPSKVASRQRGILQSEPVSTSASRADKPAPRPRCV